MTADDVVEIVRLFNRKGIDLYLDGGWGVDALLGEQTRSHDDLDIAVRRADVAAMRSLLTAAGFHDVPRKDTREWNFVLGDARGRLIDVHVHDFGPHYQYPAGSLTGLGSLNGEPVKCVAATWLIQFHSGYELDEKDYHDVKALCRRFGIELPAEYRRFETRGDGQSKPAMGAP